jgi:hypothetical protein
MSASWHWLKALHLSAVDKLWQDSRKFDVTLVVGKESPLAGSTVDEAGLMDLIYIMPTSYKR